MEAEKWVAFGLAALWGAVGGGLLELIPLRKLRERWRSRQREEPRIPSYLKSAEYWKLTIADIVGGAVLAGVHGYVHPLNALAALNLGAFWPLAFSAYKSRDERQDPGQVR